MSASLTGVPGLTPSHTGQPIIALKHSGVATIATSAGVARILPLLSGSSQFLPKFQGVPTVLPERPDMADVQLLVGSTNLVRLSKLKNVNDGSFPEDATVTFTVYTSPGGVAVVGATDIAMPKKAGTSGAATVYEGAIEETVALAVGSSYKVAIKAIKAGDQRIFNVVAKAVDG